MGNKKAMFVHVHVSSLKLLKSFQLNSFYRVCDSKFINVFWI